MDLKKTRVVSLVFTILLIFIDGSDEIHSHYMSTNTEDASSELALRSDESCSLPASWAGSWFQSGVLQTIHINLTVISTKGQCVEADRDKFVLYKREDNTFRCVVFHEKHKNVLQYKESFPRRGRVPLQSLCSTIHGDSNLFTMFRLDGDPIECPFLGPFTFTYDRGHGKCQNPISNMDTCIETSRVLLNYQACPDVHGTESHAEELQCLATWREGSTRFLLGLMQYRYPSSYEERFRCFAYEKPMRKYGQPLRNTSSDEIVYLVAQSGDASCIGITSTEGSRTLTLRKASTPKPCQFPSWLRTHAQWETLDQKIRYVFETTAFQISNFSESAGSMVIRRGTCMQILDHPSPPEKVTLVVHSTSECEIGYTCMTIYRRNGHIIEVQTGNLSRKLESACHLTYFDPDTTPLTTLTSPTPDSQQCPQFGVFDMIQGFKRHDIQDLSSPCKNPGESTFSAGCSSFDTFHFQTSCSKAETYLCNGWWEEPNGEEFLIATRTQEWNSNQSQRFCFTFREIFPEPKELKAKKVQNFEEYDDSTFDDPRRRLRKTFRFSRFSETCRRHITPTNLAEFNFTLTLRDSCAQASTGSSGSSTHISRNILQGILSAAFVYSIRFGQYFTSSH